MLVQRWKESLTDGLELTDVAINHEEPSSSKITVGCSRNGFVIHRYLYLSGNYVVFLPIYEKSVFLVEKPFISTGGCLKILPYAKIGECDVSETELNKAFESAFGFKNMKAEIKPISTKQKELFPLPGPNDHRVFPFFAFLEKNPGISGYTFAEAINTVSDFISRGVLSMAKSLEEN